MRKLGVGGRPLDLGAYLEGQEDLVTRLSMGIIGVTIGNNTKMALNWELKVF